MIPETPISSTTGESTRDRPVASSSRSPRPKMRMISGAASIRSPVTRAEDDEDEPEEGRGHAPGALPLVLLEQLAEDRHERAR